MQKNIIIGVIILVAVVAIWWIFKRRDTTDIAKTGCLSPDRKKFDVPWKEDKIPHGDLGSIAAEFLEGDSGPNGSLVGGFFKAIDLYPQMTSAKYYQDQMKAWVLSNKGVPYWNVVQGEFLCQN